MTEGKTTMDLQMIPIEKIVEDAGQVRRAVDEPSLEGLANSIRQHGVLNPITVVALEGIDGYRIITGERRWRAAQRAGIYELPCIVRGGEPEDRTAEQLIENLQREDLTPIDKATALRRLKETLGANNREVAQRLGISERTVGYLLDLLELPEAIGEQIISSPNRPADGNLTEKHGRFLRQLNEKPEVQADLVEKIRNERLSSDDTGKVVRALRQNPDRADEILAADLDSLPSLLGLGEDKAFSTGRALAQIVESIPGNVDSISLENVSDTDLPALDAALTAARAALERKQAEVRARLRNA
jgi:ParB family chromosome partitioning protein